MPQLALEYAKNVKGRFKHFLYRIEDENAEPWYVGVTSDPVPRARKHGNSRKQYVAKRMHERGIENFTMVVYGGSNCCARIHTREIGEMVRLKTLRCDFPDNPNACNVKRSGPNFFHDLTPEEQDAHRELVRKARIKSHRNRVKQGLAGHGAIPVRFANRNFPSIKAAAEFAGVAPGTMRRWLRQGYSDFPPHHGHRREEWFTWRGQQFTFVREVARIEGVPLATMHGWIKKGLTDYPPGWLKEIEWMGGIYTSYSAAAKATGVHESTVRRNVAEGRSWLPPGPGRAVIWQGKEHPSVRALSRAINVPLSTVQIWVNAGLDDFPPDWSRRLA